MQLVNSVIDSRVGTTHPCATYLWFILTLVYRKKQVYKHEASDVYVVYN